jgi:hypothetical protein
MLPGCRKSLQCVNGQVIRTIPRLRNFAECCRREKKKRNRKKRKNPKRRRSIRFSETMNIIENVECKLDPEALIDKYHVPRDTDMETEFRELVDQLQKIGRPRAVYKEAFIEDKGEDTVIVEGVTFTSRALRKNLDEVERVFVHIATCGTEADTIEIDETDMLKNFWHDMVKAQLLNAATKQMNEEIDRTFRLEKTAVMRPGSGDANVWPISQQKELFSLFGDVEELIGVKLSDSFLMNPNKSVSGFKYLTEKDFRSCQLCHRENCPGRTAEFDQKLWDEMEDSNK